LKKYPENIAKVICKKQKDMSFSPRRKREEGRVKNEE
jgi:hypothetical protein